MRDEGQNDRENKYQTLIIDLIDSLKVIGKIYKEIKTLKKYKICSIIQSPYLIEESIN
ncbi:BhlA/UviB family holin-like peptide [Clostridioides difficile]|uniref:BhlA/UviB family holin-like peptide n=1 Tax=Clostridioides difficile TaxID=1496 RepID=UPI00164CC5D4